MLIEFLCTNITDYDPAKGRGVTCGERLVVSDDKVGEMITCTKCKQNVEVPFEVPTPAKKSTQKKAKKPSRPSVASTKSKKKSHKLPAQKRSSQVVLPEYNSDLMEFEFEQQQSASTTFSSSETRCPKCGGLIGEGGKCQKCRYVEQKFESRTMAFDKIPMQLAGMQRWICHTTTEGVSFKVISVVITTLVLVLSGILILVGILVQGIPGALLISFACITAIVYCLFAYKGYQVARSPRAKLAWFQKPFWNLLLVMARATKWSGYDSRLKNRPIIDMRNSPLVDEKIPYIEGLDKCQVLDLEGTLISDRGLNHLYGHKYLHCLVLRKTNISHESVIRLQQSMPRVWIWY